MQTIIIFFLILLLPLVSFSGTINNTINAAQQQAEKITKAQENSIKPLAQQSRLASVPYQSEIKQMVLSAGSHSELNMTHQEKQSTPQALLFVSLGMPTRLLRDYLREAHHYHIPVVIRGLVNNDMRQTLTRIQMLLQLPDGTYLQGGLMIHPLWFRTYHITRVPTLIVNTNVSQQSSDVTEILGNLSLKSLLMRIAQSDQVSVRQFAETILNTAEKS